jgi:hypothetical protein
MLEAACFLTLGMEAVGLTDWFNAPPQNMK